MIETLTHSEQPDTSPDPLLVVDRVALEMIRGAGPVRFALAQSQSEKEQLFRLRYQAVIQGGWASPSDFPDAMERDDYDKDAILVAGWLENHLAATARVVTPDNSRMLPAEQAFGILFGPPGDVVEWDRLLVSPQYRSRGHGVMAGVLGRCWIETRRLGLSQVAGSVEVALLPLYSSLGITFRLLGPSRVYWGEARYPVLFDLPASIPALSKKWRSVSQV